GATYDKPASSSLVTFDMLHLPVFSDVDPAVQRQLSTQDRASGFEEVVGGLSEPEARHEAQRCLSCGNCFECDNCYGACPEQAIVKLGKGRVYRVELDLFTGCATCFDQGPCHGIDMTPEPGVEGSLERNAAERVPARFTVRP